MRETLELRMSEEEARRYLPQGVGKTLPSGHVRKIVLDTRDPLVEKLRALEAEEAARDSTLFTTCAVSRLYTPRELQAAELLFVEFWPFFEPAGEECGTVYDESTACSWCGVGACQASPLHMQLRRIPKARDISLTMGGEIIVSKRLAEALREHHITGHQLHPVLDTAGRATGDWFQLLIPSHTVEAVPPTQFGRSYLAPEPDASRCPHGHVAGHRILSPLHVSRASLDGNDWACTRQHLGVRRGLGRPYPMYLISQHLYRLLLQLKVRRFSAEVAHVA
jgi:hypothetical protein